MPHNLFDAFDELEVLFCFGSSFFKCSNLSFEGADSGPRLAKNLIRCAAYKSLRQLDYRTCGYELAYIQRAYRFQKVSNLSFARADYSDLDLKGT